MIFKEIEKYLFDDCIVRNEEFEYKTDGDDMFCREIGTEKWWCSYRIGDYEKKMEWELVGKKMTNKISSILLECSAKISMYEKHTEGGHDYNEEIETNEIIMKALRLLLKSENDDSHVMHGKLPF